jgi:two-component system phosphate regulon sensor histidine kinase PhoR
MSRHSLFLKLFLGNLLLVLLIIATGGVISHRSLEAYHRENQLRQQKQLTAMAQLLVQRLWSTMSDNPASIDALCKRWRERSDEPARLTVIASDGVVLGDSSVMPAARMENHRTPSRPEVMAALDGREGSDIRLSDTLGREFRYMASPIRRDGQIVGAVRVAMPLRALVESRGMILRSLLLAAAASVLAAVVLGLLISWVWYVPLRQLALTARSIASGNLKQKARSVGSLELAQLADALNDMRESLAHQIETIAAQRANLQTVVVNMREGLIVTDTSEEIVLMNRQAADILDVVESDAVGSHIQRIVRVPDMIDLYRQCRETDILVSRQLEIEVKGRMRTLQVTVSPVRQGPSQGLGTLMVLHDVTDITRAAATKAEFVVNASHELRTPLAVIRAAVESLIESGREDEQTFEKCARMLDRHVNRLEQVTMDLLDLHAVESAGRSPLQVAPIQPQELGEWIEAQFAGRADEKGVTLDVNVEASGDEDFCSDRKLLEMILQNLVGNALKFTPPEGRVACRLHFDGRELTMRVADTGCGIKSEDQPRVFERFFQADRSRTGDTAVRGSGLGLAIVKHAAERLRASVDLESTVGEGTTVTVVVPNRRRALQDQPPADER